MKIYGIIMEINPFHNGHIHFINEVRKIAKDNPIICVISTNFVQRGEASVLNKEIKTELLLSYDVDLVLELPMVLANQGGMYFAYEAIKILNHFHITDLCFGSETADINHLIKNASIDYPMKDFEKGIHHTLGDFKSNDILAISYIKAINKINNNIQVHTIKRVSNNYNDEILTDRFASSTSIRKNYLTSDVHRFLPEKSLTSMNNIQESILLDMLNINLHISLQKNIPIFLAQDNQLLMKIQKQLKSKNYHSINDLCYDLKDKNNSKFKYQRIILNTILLITDDDIKDDENYFRVLGIKKDKFYLLKNVDGYFTSLKDNQSNICNIEKRATELYKIITGDSTYNEYNEKMIIR